MEFAKILILSTAHLHPLEGPNIGEIASLDGITCSLVNVDSEMDDYYIEKCFPCLVDLLRLIREQSPDVDYVMFDADGRVEDQFRTFDW
jgi:hypothetical protein